MCNEEYAALITAALERRRSCGCQDDCNAWYRPKYKFGAGLKRTAASALRFPGTHGLRMINLNVISARD